MNEKIVSNEQAIIEEALRRRRLNEPGIPSEKVKRFKAMLGEEIERTGKLSQEYVDHLLQQLKNREL
jgi:hypothetical protein